MRNYSALGISEQGYLEVGAGGWLRVCRRDEFLSVEQQAALRQSRHFSRAPVRGVVKSFSTASRRRLLRQLGSVDARKFSGRVTLVTLTWPSTIGQLLAVDGSYVYLRNFVKRISRAFPGVFVFWRKEYTRAGAVHYHLAVFGPAVLSRQKISRAWWQVCGRISEDHLRAGTRVEKPRSPRAWVVYLCKEMSKADQATVVNAMNTAGAVSVGRAWGVFGREFMLANSLLVSSDLEPADYVKLHQ